MKEILKKLTAIQLATLVTFSVVGIQPIAVQTITIQEVAR